ncbi:MAG TPA: hypothetical protein ENK43_06315 [Planctomycetes bacterium]|nr:hypothetical protein [Planctomycetota bacterium]
MAERTPFMKAWREALDYVKSAKELTNSAIAERCNISEVGLLQGRTRVRGTSYELLATFLGEFDLPEDLAARLKRTWLLDRLFTGSLGMAAAVIFEHLKTRVSEDELNRILDSASEAFLRDAGGKTRGRRTR